MHRRSKYKVFLVIRRHSVSPGYHKWGWRAIWWQGHRRRKISWELRLGPDHGGFFEGWKVLLNSKVMRSHWWLGFVSFPRKGGVGAAQGVGSSCEVNDVLQFGTLENWGWGVAVQSWAKSGLTSVGFWDVSSLHSHYWREGWSEDRKPGQQESWWSQERGMARTTLEERDRTIMFWWDGSGRCGKDYRKENAKVLT